jgi:predicted phosphodiesterase
MLTLTDEEFINLWTKHKSPSKISMLTGVRVRSIYSRRRSLEEKYGIELTVIESSPAVVERHSHKINFDIDNGSVIVFSDAHFWDEDPNTAYRALIYFIKELKPQLIVANGDIFDGASNSRHASINWEKKPSLIQELNACKAMMDGVVNSAVKGTQLTWCMGNHDSRFETYLAANAPQYQEVEGFSLKDHFPEWRMCWATWINGHTVIKHRWKGGIHATHNNTVNSGVSIVTGHLHSLKVTPFTDYTGTRYGVDTGCLADVDGNQFVNYLETNPTNWRSGFAVLNFHNGDLLPPELVQVLDEGVVAFRGKAYEV